ncbi:MAG: O-antigen ligase family protein [Proteobacteria bacterium]|nr:O-antigen ligase family protein [Pseudomonadota bacterium]
MTASVYRGEETTSTVSKVLFVLLILCSALNGSYLFGGVTSASAVQGASGSGDLVRQVLFGSLFLLIVLNVLAVKGAEALLVVPIGLAVLLAWCWLSVFWAIDPAVSFRRVAYTTIVALSVIYSISMIDDRTVMQILVWCIGLIVAADWLVMPILPQAIHQLADSEPGIAGAWRGIHAHKNEAGAFYGVAVLLFLDMAIRNCQRSLALVLLALSLGFLAMTNSKTSIGFVLVAALLGLLYVHGYRNPLLRKVLVFWAAGFAILAFLAVQDHLPDVLAYFDDPRSLSGRITIWDAMLDYAANNLPLGSGYGSFWAIGNASPIAHQGEEWLTLLGVGDSGYLDVLVQTGLTGLMILVAGLILHPLFILVAHDLRTQQMRWLLGAVLTFAWLHNFLETSFLNRAHILWVFTLIAYDLLIRQARPQRLP